VGFVKLPPRWSAALHEGFAPLKRTLLEFKAARHAARPFVRLRIPVVERPPTAGADPVGFSVVRLRKRDPRSLAIEADGDWLRTRSGFSTLWRRLGVFVDLVSDVAVPAGEWAAELGDRVTVEGPLLGFCSNFQQTVLVPDRGFFASRGYARQRRQAAAAPPFDDRDGTILWRGSPSGIGAVFKPDMDPADTGLRQRVRMCLLLREAAPALAADGGVDARIMGGSNLAADPAAHAALAGILGPRVPQSSWSRRKFAIDIDGNANAFSNLFIRLIYGCCVIKVGSPCGFRQWYYEDLRPWEHFIPVAADLSDLVEKIAWCRRHPAECRAVARAGQSLALSMTMDRERSRAIASLLAQAPFGDTHCHAPATTA
jgi:hypothetical protein